MKPMTKAMRLYRRKSLNDQWNLLSKARKRYARYLVERYAYGVGIAIQRAYIWGYDKWPYDYRNNTVVEETVPASKFGYLGR